VIIPANDPPVTSPQPEESADQPEKPADQPEKPADQPEDPDPSNPIQSVAITGIQPVTNGTPRPSITKPEYVGLITWSSVQPATDYTKFQFFTDYTAVIELVMRGGHSLPPANAAVKVEGALSAVYNAAAGTITATFPRTHYPVDSVAELNVAVAAVKPLPSPSNPNNENVIDLTEAFYDTVNDTVNDAGAFIPIGLSSTDNSIPYTVRGLGRFSPKKLTAGVLLANNNITLEDVRIEITGGARGVPRAWTPTLNYRAALLIGRYTTTTTSFGAGLGSQNVTVRNCNISFRANDSMIAGIYISDGTGQNVVSIDRNEVAVDTLGGISAAQAILIHRCDPGISITGNGLQSKNIPIDNPTQRPAGALLIQILPGPDIDSATPRITGNMINGSPTYDFYINILSPGENRIGIPALFKDNFATPNSRWMTAASTDTGPGRSFYKKLLEALFDQSRSGAGYSCLFMYFDGSLGSFTDCVWESYSRQSSRLYAIDFWGYTIDSSQYRYTDSDVRARLLVDPNGSVYEKDAQFYWAPNIPGTETNNGLNLPQSP
jgi:hypothetical protein